VVVADDPASAAAVRLAADLAARVDGEVLALHVSRRDVPCRGPSAAECGLREDGASLDWALGQLRRAGVRHRGERWQALTDRVLETVLAVAEEYDATLLIVGGHRPPGLLGRFQRGLGLRLAARATRPVLLVR
jgi:nucleotide-binding universal stress UspA family protein